MNAIPRRDSLPPWPGPHVNPGMQPGPPPFQGAPPPMPAGYGYNQQQWAQGVWVQNPSWNPQQYPMNPNNAWMPGASWGPHPAYQQPGYPGGRPPPNAQQQASFNPYKRQVKPPSAEYLSQPISNNGLQLDSLVEAPNRYGDEAQLTGPKTPWIWNPLTLQNDGESPARPSRQNSAESHTTSSDSNSSGYDSSSTERGSHQPPSRHATEPMMQRTARAPPIAAPLARHATEPVLKESFTSDMELRPTFSPSVVVTPEHYKSPRSNRMGSSASLHTTYNQGEQHRPSAGSVDALSEQMNRTRFDSFSSGSSGNSSGMFSSPATASSFSSYGSGSGSFGNGVSPSKSSHPNHNHSQSIAGLTSLTDEPESYPDANGSGEILSPIRPSPMLPADSARRKHRQQKHEPSPLRREATEPVFDQAPSLSTIPEQYNYNSHRRRQSSRQGSMEPEDHQVNSYRYTTPTRSTTPPSRPSEDSPSRSHSRTPSRQGSASSYYETPSRRGSSSRYSPPEPGSYRPSSRQASVDVDRQQPLTPPEPGFEPADRASHLRPYNPLPDPPRYHETRQKTPPKQQYKYEDNFVLQAAPVSRSGAGHSSQIYASSGQSTPHIYTTNHDAVSSRAMPPVTPKRSPPGSATSPAMQQPTPRHTPLSFDPLAHLHLPVSPRPSRTPVPVDQPPLPMPRYIHVPMPLPPSVPTDPRSVRGGYWNKRGDHLTATGYVVYAPVERQYHPELADYPDVGEGYKNELGLVIAYEERPELITSTSRDGLPPATPYMQFIQYKTRNIPKPRATVN